MYNEIDTLFLQDLEDEGFDVSKLTSYSGRGMYGDYCFGLIGGLEDFATFLLTVVEVHGNDWASTFTRVSTDSMGLDSVYYWRRVTLTEDAKVWLEENGEQ